MQSGAEIVAWRCHACGKSFANDPGGLCRSCGGVTCANCWGDRPAFLPTRRRQRQCKGCAAARSENARMPERLSRLHVTLTRVVAISVAAGSAVLLVYWASQTARGLPDEYRGQTGGGLFLNLYLFTSLMSQLIEKPRVRVPRLVMSVVCLGAAMYFIFAHRAADIHLPRG